MDVELLGAPPPSKAWSHARGQHPFWGVSALCDPQSCKSPAEYFSLPESAAVLSSCYVNDCLMNYVLYTLHTNPVPTSPGRRDHILAGVSSAPGNLPGGHTIIHALLMLCKSCSLCCGCCAADPSIRVPLSSWWLTASPCMAMGSPVCTLPLQPEQQHRHPSAQEQIRALCFEASLSWLSPCYALLPPVACSSIRKAK